MTSISEGEEDGPWPYCPGVERRTRWSRWRWRWRWRGPPAAPSVLPSPASLRGRQFRVKLQMIFTGCLCLTWLNYAGKNLSYDLIKRLSLFQFNFPNKMFLLESTWRVPERRRIRMCNMAARQAASHWPLASTGVTSHLVNRLASLHLHITYLSTLETEDRYNVQYIIYNIIYI